jgi:hypothetical protein
MKLVFVRMTAIVAAAVRSGKGDDPSVSPKAWHHRPMRRLPVAIAALALLAGCGDDDEAEPRIPGTPDPEHAREVARNPYALTCADIARQPLHSESQHLVINAEFALARDPSLRELVPKLTMNRVGRSVYYGLTEECKGRHPSFRPARPAIAGVLSGKYRAARNRPG